MRNDEIASPSRRDVMLAAAASGAAVALDATRALPAKASPTSGGAASGGPARTGASEAGPSAAGQFATGQVYELVDGSRRGLGGILVSNGSDVAVSDPEGRYSLPVTDETIVFVIKPTGFRSPVDPATRLPRFFHIHQPDGSPATLKLAYPGIAPTGPLPASIDFELIRAPEPAAFEVVLFTDPQPESDAEIDFIREDLVGLLADTTAAFAIGAGDMMFDDLSLYDRFNRIIGTIGIPWYVVGGNHDLNFEAPGRRYSRETFKRVYGPPHHAFAVGDAVFLMLDDVEYLGFDPARPRGAAGYVGHLDGEQLAFVRNVLAHVPADKLIVVVLHIPLRNYLDSQAPDTNLTNRAELLALLEGRRFTVSFSGHTHTTEHHYLTKAEGWPNPEPHHHHVLTAVSGSWWSGPYDHRGVAVADSRDGTPNGFHILSIDGTAYRTRFIPAKEPERRQLRISVLSHGRGGEKEVMRTFRPGELIQPPIRLAAVPSTTIVANVFDGGPRTRVHLRLGSREPIAMDQVARPDPFVVEVFGRNEATKKPWVKAEVSSHVWTARLPSDLPAGTHRLTVSAVTEYGRTINATVALEVV